MPKPEKQKSRLDARQVIYELQENPLRKFKVAFILMSLIPLLVVLCLLLNRFFSFSILAGNTGLVLLITVIISFLGFALGYGIVIRLLNRLMFYAAKFRESDEQKSALVANVSHEVRNPLAIVKMTLSNLADEVTGKMSDIQKKVVGRCQKTIDRLIRLVSELLDLSKIEAGRFLMKRMLINVNSLIDNELLNFTPALKDKKVKLVKQTPDLPITIWGDQDKITQVFINLMDNAVKYTSLNSKVSIKLLSVNDNIRLEIKDTGEGIPEDKLDKVFDKFERITHQKEIGTGLGLPIAKDIVQMHRGRIWVESEVGKGSKFIVLLPKDLRGEKKLLS